MKKIITDFYVESYSKKFGTVTKRFPDDKLFDTEEEALEALRKAHPEATRIEYVAAEKCGTIYIFNHNGVPMHKRFRFRNKTLK
jgi:hypothetical protein